MLDELKRFDKDRISIEEAVALSAYARVYRNEAEVLGLETPDWFDQRVKELHREIEARKADQLDARLTKLKSRRAALLTPDEKRADIDKQIAELETKKQGV